MNFPSAFLDELKSRLSLADVVGRKVTWDRKKSQPGKGDYWACCPFHGETTPSFHVMDRQGYYKCFGCDAKGSVFDFVMETENLSFPESVKFCAELAGMALPQIDPRAAAREEKRKGLIEAMEEAVRYYRTQLGGARAEAARSYLTRRRQLSPETVERFEIGFAPPGNDALYQHLLAKGFERRAIVEAGLAAEPEDGRAPYDRFRDRIMFPIRDPSGRCIAFGGRAMAKDAMAKYMNSPATPLFDKSRVLYNHGPARRAAGPDRPLIVAEGYMDVIALVEAGFEAAVAPLGTALTEAHLELLWRMSPEPVMALDGDEAGLRAAHRAADLALPQVGPAKRVRFALLPGGKDPDDLVRGEGGREAMRALIDGAAPMSDLLWGRATAAARLDTPEGKAAFERELAALSAKIQDPSTRRHYEQEFKDRRYRLYREMRGPQPSSQGRAGGARGRGGAWPPLPGPAPETRSNALAGPGGGLGAEPDEAQLRVGESFLTLALLNHPPLLEKWQMDVEGLSFFCDDLDTVRRALLSALLTMTPQDVDAARRDLEKAVEDRCGAGVAARLRGEVSAIRARDIVPEAPLEVAERAFLSAWRPHAQTLEWMRENRELEEDLLADPDERAMPRLREKLRERDRAARGDDGATKPDQDDELDKIFKETIRKALENPRKPKGGKQ